VLKHFVKVREEKFGAVIFDTKKEKVYVTNEIGKEILNLIKNGKTAEEIAQYLSHSYDEDPDIIKRDVLNFLEDLRKSNLM
jgi:hypothetical protein